MGETCGHGSLRRSCEICERDDIIEEWQVAARKVLKGWSGPVPKEIYRLRELLRSAGAREG